MEKTKKEHKNWMYWFMLGLALIVVLKLLDNFNGIIGVIGKFFDTISPILVGVFIAYILYMPCRKLENFFKKRKSKFLRKKSRFLSILSVYIIAIVIISIIIGVILPVIIESIADLLNNLQYYYEITMRNYNKLPEDSILKGEYVKEIFANIQNIDIKQYVQIDKIMSYMFTALQAATGVFEIFVAVIVSIYTLSERTKIVAFLNKMTAAIVDENTYKNIGKYFNNSNEIFFKFIACQFVDAVIIGILITVVFSIMGIKYAPLLGFLIGLFNIIPYIGAIIATIIAVFITIITGGLNQAIWMLIITIILQQIDANVINPKIVGQSLKISPLLILFAVTVGGAYFGILGMFLAVPIVAVIRIAVDDYLSYRLQKKGLSKKEQETIDWSKII